MTSFGHHCRGNARLKRFIHSEFNEGDDGAMRNDAGFGTQKLSDSANSTVFWVVAFWKFLGAHIAPHELHTSNGVDGFPIREVTPNILKGLRTEKNSWGTTSFDRVRICRRDKGERNNKEGYGEALPNPRTMLTIRAPHAVEHRTLWKRKGTLLHCNIKTPTMRLQIPSKSKTFRGSQTSIPYKDGVDRRRYLLRVESLLLAAAKDMKGRDFFFGTSLDLPLDLRESFPMLM